MPYHQFIAGKKEDTNHEWLSWEQGHVWRGGVVISPQAVIDDDLFDYMYDTFRWLRAQYPNGQWGNGLDNYGSSLIQHPEDIRKLQEIAIAWKSLFGAGPEEIGLTGNYGWDGADPQNGFYEKLKFPKHELIQEMDHLIEVTEKALETGICVIHFGI
ncbi:hypothetical protein [Saccharibacillus sacchari]|uniref:hypothetical protein n=1 Tax=Saccharibacillus sacchari TaxID=456493 RepID=UPI0004ADAE3F|nr:hypothetical protein [Saccharibacillus sacchari]